jgi:hypothetical protein
MHAGRTQRVLMELSQKIGGPFFCMRNVLLVFGVWCLVLDARAHVMSKGGSDADQYLNASRSLPVFVSPA